MGFFANIVRAARTPASPRPQPVELRPAAVHGQLAGESRGTPSDAGRAPSGEALDPVSLGPIALVGPVGASPAVSGETDTSETRANSEVSTRAEETTPVFVLESRPPPAPVDPAPVDPEPFDPTPFDPTPASPGEDPPRWHKTPEVRATDEASHAPPSPVIATAAPTSAGAPVPTPRGHISPPLPEARTPSREPAAAAALVDPRSAPARVASPIATEPSEGRAPSPDLKASTATTNPASDESLVPAAQWSAPEQTAAAQWPSRRERPSTERPSAEHPRPGPPAPTVHIGRIEVVVVEQTAPAPEPPSASPPDLSSRMYLRGL